MILNSESGKWLPQHLIFRLFFVSFFLLQLQAATAQEGVEKERKTRKSEVRKKRKDKNKPVQKDGYFDENFIDYTTKVYDQQIRTVIMHTTASELEPPVINLNGTEQIVLRFDDLGDDVRDLYYTFEHCTYDWKSSDLLDMDFIEGYTSDFIANYDFSFNTVIPYVHYELTFPNDRVGLKRSGNYIIKVFEDDDPEKVILTARFMVVEPITNIEMKIMPTRVVSERNYRQDVDLKVNLKSLETLNPYSDIELVVRQNFRWDNAIWNLKPSFVKDNVLIYDYQGKLTFDGTNEFRMFDAKSARYRSDRVSDVVLQENGYHVYLSPDPLRGFLNYSFNPDINGRFLIKNDDMSDPHLESDYFHIHFYVPVDAPLGNGDLYVWGQVSNWRMKKDFRLKYNPDDLSYQLTIPLKQGLYNYQYLWRSKNKDEGSTDRTEGNHSEAENEYMVLVYFKDRSSFSHRLVGYKLDSNYED